MGKKTGLGSKKDLNAELNLTPFIDLLSTCVCFLLITAVWIEVGSIEIKQSHGTKAEVSKKESYDLDIVFRTPTSLRLNLKKNGRRLRGIDIKSESFEEAMGKFHQAIGEKILSYKGKSISIASATVSPRSNVDYGNLIETLDVLRKNDIVNIGVLSVKGR